MAARKTANRKYRGGSVTSLPRCAHLLASARLSGDRRHTVLRMNTTMGCDAILAVYTGCTESSKNVHKIEPIQLQSAPSLSLIFIVALMLLGPLNPCVTKYIICQSLQKHVVSRSLTCKTAAATVASQCCSRSECEMRGKGTTDRSVWESDDASDGAGLHTRSLFLCLTFYTVPWLRWAGSASSHPYRGCLVGICFGSISAMAGKENSRFCTMTWWQVLSSHAVKYGRWLTRL